MEYKIRYSILKSKILAGAYTEIAKAAKGSLSLKMDHSFVCITINYVYRSK